MILAAPTAVLVVGAPPVAGGGPMSVQGYAATPYLRQLTPENGWRGQLIRDPHGRADLIVTVRVGLTFTDTVAIESEDHCVAMRHRTHESRLVLPTELPSESRAVWQRDGRCEDVLAELLELPPP